MENLNPLVGKKINKLTVIAIAQKDPSLKRKRTRVIVQCECGKTNIVDGAKFNSGIIQSCGCIRKGMPQPHSRIGYGESSRNKIIDSYKRNAANKGNSFDLSKEDMINYFESDCYYCNRAPYKIFKQKGGYGEYTYNGIDRLDNNLGYSKENCVSCCSECNYLKNKYHVNDFLKLIRMISENTKHILLK